MEMPKSINTLQRRIAAKIKSLGGLGIFMTGSLVEKRWKCGRTDCICSRTGKLHTAHVVTSKVAGKTKSIYIPVDMVGQVKQWTKEYKKLQKTVKEISALAEMMIRITVPTARAVRQRNRSLASTTRTSDE